MTSILCTLITVFVQFPQTILDAFYGIFGEAAPDLTFGVGSLFGCNL